MHAYMVCFITQEIVKDLQNEVRKIKLVITEKNKEMQNKNNKKEELINKNNELLLKIKEHSLEIKKLQDIFKQAKTRVSSNKDLLTISFQYNIIITGTRVL